MFFYNLLFDDNRPAFAVLRARDSVGISLDINSFLDGQNENN